MCCIQSADACSNVWPAVTVQFPELEYLCTQDGREGYIEGLFEDNFTACAESCSGALAYWQELLVLQSDSLSADEPSSANPSKRKLARLREHACANVEVVQCAAVSGGAGFEACATGSTPEPLADPASWIEDCAVALAVKVEMKLTVEDPVEFCDEPANVEAVAAGIAAAAGVGASDVDAVLTPITERRLQMSLRRVQGGNVDIDATIHTVDAEAAEAMVTTVSAITSDTMADEIATAFEAADLNVTITVEEIGTPVTQTADQAVAEAAAASSTGSTGTSGAAVDAGVANGAHQASVAASVLGVLAVIAATAIM